MLKIRENPNKTIEREWCKMLEICSSKQHGALGSASSLAMEAQNKMAFGERQLRSSYLILNV